MPDDCPFQSRLSAFYDHELDAATAGEVESHLTGCPSCAQDLQSIQTVGQLISNAPIRPISQMGLARLHALADSSSRNVSAFPMARAMIAAAASILIISGAWLVELPAVHPDSTHLAQTSDRLSGQTEWWESVASGEGKIGQPANVPATGMVLNDRSTRFSDWMLSNLKEDASR